MSITTHLGRRWIGIDSSPRAVELVNMRLQQSMGNLFHNLLVTARTDIPRRTDIDAPVPYRLNKHVRFDQQEGRCNGCRSEFPFRILEVDHIILRGGGGGQDNIENLQLLCAHCNRVKGDRPQEYLVARLPENGDSSLVHPVKALGPLNLYVLSRPTDLGNVYGHAYRQRSAHVGKRRADARNSHWRAAKIPRRNTWVYAAIPKPSRISQF